MRKQIYRYPLALFAAGLLAACSGDKNEGIDKEGVETVLPAQQNEVTGQQRKGGGTAAGRLEFPDNIGACGTHLREERRPGEAGAEAGRTGSFYPQKQAGTGRELLETGGAGNAGRADRPGICSGPYAGDSGGHREAGGGEKRLRDMLRTVCRRFRRTS